MLSFHYRQDSPQTLTFFTNIYKDMDTRMSQFISKLLSAVLFTYFNDFAYKFIAITINLI